MVSLNRIPFSNLRGCFDCSNNMLISWQPALISACVNFVAPALLQRYSCDGINVRFQRRLHCMNAIVLSFLVVVGSTVLSVAGMLFVRKRFPIPQLREHHEVAGYLVGIVGTLYAVLLGLVSLMS